MATSSCIFMMATVVHTNTTMGAVDQLSFTSSTLDIIEEYRSSATSVCRSNCSTYWLIQERSEVVFAHSHSLLYIYKLYVYAHTIIMKLISWTGGDMLLVIETPPTHTQDILWKWPSFSSLHRDIPILIIFNWWMIWVQLSIIFIIV